MKFVLLIGDAAVGKMTVGQHLEKITKLKLFHNHMTIEPVIEIFGKYNATVIRKWRNVVFEEYSKTDNYGLIFTFMWDFDLSADWEYVQYMTEVFEKENGTVYYVELDAPLEVRLCRNKTENRLKHKASKRDLTNSEAMLLHDSVVRRCISRENEVPYKNYLRINNTNLSPDQVAAIIKNHFNL
ncbi:AAA family ATPase [Holdemania filiformis]|uniref:AAA family ATPase n=1 Tax=Holdemania filiformis TaxID=61171 RepID=UPI00267541C3|nr:AAA family ATPase [Holdemania filiformis]